MENIIAITIIITTLVTMFICGYFADKAIESKEKQLRNHYSFEIDLLKYSKVCQEQTIENLREKLNNKPRYSIRDSITRYVAKQNSEPIKASDLIDPNAFDGIKKDIEDVIGLLGQLEKRLKNLGK